MSRHLTASGPPCPACTKTSDPRRVTRQTYRNKTETPGKSCTHSHGAGGKSPTRGGGREKTSDGQPSKNCDREKDNVRRSDPILMTCTRPPLSSLLSQCKRLEEENASMLRRIVGIEDEAMKSATQQLQQYDRAGSNVRAVQTWTEHQGQDAQQDLELTRERREERVSGLRLQLQNCEGKIQEAQKDLQQLREYRDRGHSMKALQASELERQLHVLSERHQDRATDVEALAEIEIENLLESHQKLKAGVLQGVAEQHLESLPLSLKRMCVKNKEMRSEIKAYQQMIMGLQEDIKDLLETGDSLRKSWKEETDRLCGEILLSKPRCPADEDVVLDIPMNQPMYI